MTEHTQAERTASAVPIAKGEASNPVLLLALALALGWMAVRWAEGPVEGNELPPPPPNLVDRGAGECTQPVDLAPKRAAELLARAHARWERAAFAPAVAMNALDDAHQAAACFELAKDVEQAGRATHFADVIRVETQRAYERLQLRLRVALRREDATTAVAAARDLRALLHDDRGPYGRWLLAVEQQQRSAGGAP
jgi:hypothetical protein